MQRARMHIRPPGPKSKEKLLPSGLYRRAPKPAETHPALKVVDIKFKSHHTTEAPGMIRTLVLLLQPNTSDPDPPVSPPRSLFGTRFPYFQVMLPILTVPPVSPPSVLVNAGTFMMSQAFPAPPRPTVTV